jgi:acyl-CoA synthetase (AMP-forming)/AMP-acid ligase II/acyl carrier protein
MNQGHVPNAEAAGNTIWELVFHHSSKAPDAVALVAPDRDALSFGDLKRHISELATALNAEGVGRENRVALALPNGPDLATAFLATASCATCAPLNPEQTEEAFEFFLKDLGARALVVAAGSDSRARAVALRLGIQVIEINVSNSAAAGLFTLDGASARPAEAVPELANAEDTALLLYTSGTTARPKQVPLTHANVCASARSIAGWLQLTPDDRCLNILPLFHIHGLVAALLAPLAAGGSVACTPGLAGGSFFDWLDELHPTFYTAVPTMHQAVLDGAHARRDAIRRNPLRFIRSSSAALPTPLAEALERCFDAPVVEAYGMTEAAHQIASNPLPPSLRRPKSVGMAAGPEVAVMDDMARLLPTGATGEIVIRGDNVVHGYANNPEADARAFAAGWFRTGDQGFVDAEGYVHLTGRLKEIINRGGEKVSPHEVDEALLEHAAVRQAATFRVPHTTLGEDIASAVVLEAGATATAEELRAFLFGRLAEFKIPSQLVIVAKIPTGATGKVERVRLATELADRLKPPFVAPRDGTEAQVAAIVSEVLEIADVGVDDNFFALGGDSLRGFQALARIRAGLGVDLSILDLFKGPTVGQIAREVARARQAAEAARLQQVLDELQRLADEEAGGRLRG